MRKTSAPVSDGDLSAELDRARKREAATREILEVISRSREDERPVFDAILHRAADLCNATAAALTMGREGDTHQRLVAHYGVSPNTVEIYDRGEVPMDPAISLAAQAILAGESLHIADMMDTEGYRRGDASYVSVVRDTGVRTELYVPLVTPAGGIGSLILFRTEVRPFTADEITIVETFAAQAVIAIENVRQFRELQTRLAREAATGEILAVISRSPDDDLPVFDTIVENALRLCGARMTALILAAPEDELQRLVAHRGISDETVEMFRSGRMPVKGDVSYAARAIVEGRVIQFEDMGQSDLYLSGSPVVRAMVDQVGIRSVIFVPLMAQGGAIGVITVFRYETRPFDDRLISLIQSFAAQAVIAIENVRQFRELQTRLAREAATREILEVISQSREDDRPVFDVVLRKAAELCGASMAGLNIISEDRSQAVMVAEWGDHVADLRPVGETVWPMGSDHAPSTCMREGRVVHVHDLGDTDLYRSGDPIRVTAVDIEGIRTFLAVPLFSGGKTESCISIYRREVRPFTPDEIALVETFAAQAVIAIENTSQFRAIQMANSELQTRLAREAATREILEVISQSRDDDAPVFEMVLRKAAELCHASLASLFTIEDRNRLVLVAAWGEHVADPLPAGIAEWSMDSPTAVSTCLREGRVVHIHDLADTDLYRSGDPIRVHVVDAEGMRTLLAVPLLRGKTTESCISIYRREVRPFTADEITLVETFAAQAVIAIENVRQFRELQTRLAREKASAEILEIISQSRDDEKPVFDVILRKSADLCGASMANLELISEDRSHAVMAAHWGDTLRHHVVGATAWSMESELAQALYIHEGRVVHVRDLADTDLYRSGDPNRVADVDGEGIRTFLGVPLFSGGKTIGCIALYRREVNPFGADQIALIETFAAQAVIAIENVRQFRELQARLAREAATREILEVISQSRDDERPVFDAVLGNAVRLCGASGAGLLLGRKEGPHLTLAALHETGELPEEGLEELIAKVNRTPMRMDPSAHISAQAICEGAVVQVNDLAQSRNYLAGEQTFRIMVEEQGIRAILSVPLMGAGGAIGAINLHWPEERAFSPDEIALVETFAAQAVIAIENVRQFRELQDSLEKQEATSDILRVISQSREDEAQVFDLVLEKATVLCDADQGSLFIVNEARTHIRLLADRGHGRSAYPPGLEFSLDLPLSSVPTIRTGKVVHIEDYAQSDAYRDRVPIAVDLVEIEGVRTRLNVPLLQNGIAVGCISLSRRTVRPFSQPEIALVETFAAQAVIAIENVRQFRELQARLAREAATREILEVISQSRDDDAPVFDAVLRNANRLCGTSMAYLVLGRPDDMHMTLAAYVNPHLPSEDSVDQIIAFSNQTGMRMDASEHFSAKAILSGEVVQIPDIAKSQGYLSGEPTTRILVEDVGVRTILSVPMFDAQGTIGAISLQRREERLFTDDEITLIQSFAAQAVIAIENVRQFRELQARLSREEATRNILRVISESPDDEQPTFEAILDSATQLCGTQYASIILARKGDTSQRMVAHRAATAETVVFYREGKVPMDPEDSIGARAILEGRTIHVPDMADTDQYRAGHERFRMVVDRQGLRTNLFVPLLGPEGGIGCFILWKKEVAPFTADQIALMETFASHAVIAIENVRQFKALEALNAELGDRVQDQVGEIERMGRLKRFLPAAVADTVISTGSEKMLSSHRALLGVLFCDIRGFTAFCETAEPEETIEVLQTYHEEMGRLIEAHGAGVDHRMGDGIMVLFNDPIPCDDPAGQAVRLGIAMRDRMADLCKGWKKLGHKLGFGVGVSLGYATVGMVGSGGRIDYTASGTAINLASRLGDEAQDGEILISPRARLAIEDDFTIEARGEISLKGMREPVEVFRVTGAA